MCCAPALCSRKNAPACQASASRRLAHDSLPGHFEPHSVLVLPGQQSRVPSDAPGCAKNQRGAPTQAGEPPAGVDKESPLAPPITIIVPAHNEEASIRVAVRNLLELDYPELEFIVVNDGSQDRTLGEMREEFHLRPVRAVYVAELKSAPVRGLYRSSVDPRLLVVVTIGPAAVLGVLSRVFFLQFLLFGYAFATVISIGSVLQEEITYKRYNDWQDVVRLVSY